MPLLHKPTALDLEHILAAVAIGVESRGSVLVVTLNRPEVLNALDDATFDELLGVWERAGDTDVGSVVLTGSGRAFSAGADLSAPVRTPQQIVDNQRARFNANVLSMLQLDRPIVAAVNGYAVGAGLSLACAADLRIASSNAQFKPAFAQLGAVPDAGASWTIPRLVGAGRAFDWFCSNRTLDAEQALSWGLVNEVVAPEELTARSVERASELAVLPRVAVALTKRLLGAGASGDLAEQLEAEVRAQQEAAADEGRAEVRNRAARPRHTG